MALAHTSSATQPITPSNLSTTSQPIASKHSTSSASIESYTHFFENAANAPSPLNVLMESRVILEFGQFFQTIPHLKSLPQGDGHPVIVIPGFLTNDRYTSILRWVLRKLGYDVHPWALGTNRSFTLKNMQQLQKRILHLKLTSGKPVSLVGWSLGGIYARYVSNTMADHIRHVITLGTPFSRSMPTSVATRVYEMVNGQKVRLLHPDIIRKIANPVPVAATSIYSKMDGVVSWECSVCPAPGPQHEHIEIQSSHCGLTHNPAALYAITERLALPKNRWKPFDRNEMDQFLKTVKSPVAMVSNLANARSPTGLKSTLQSLNELYNEIKQPAVVTPI